LRYTPSNEQSLSLDDILDSFTPSKNATAEFETSFADYVGARESVALSSGRASLRLALENLGKEKSFEVIIPTLVCGAVADAVIAAGGIPVLCDVKATDGTIDPSKIKACISKRTRAIVAVHYQGMPCDIDEVQEISESNGISLIEDCAHAIGSKFRKKPLGGFGIYAFYSFSVDKPMTTGNGGMLTVNSLENHEKLSTRKTNLKEPSKIDELHILKLLLETNLLSNGRTYGLSSFTYFPALNFSLAALGYKQKYGMDEISKIAAMVGLRQLRVMDRIIEARIRTTNALRESLADSQTIQTIENPKTKDPVFLRYTILTRSSESRERLMRELKRVGIEAGPINWRLPLHSIAAYSHLSIPRVSFEGAEDFSSRFLNLPCHPFVSESNILEIKKCVNSI
jgi:perosamine synthetase